MTSKKPAPKKRPKTGSKSGSKSGGIVIEVMSGSEDGREVVCNEIPFTIGRANKNAVSLRCDQLISRCHARISRSDKGFTLTDLGSTNGTFVRKKKVVDQANIEQGELFRVGGTSLRIKS